jgi:isopentenyl diphosphate isomerase/L-lactate dehydrogenase-like FMN-dependent dehydrogenase
MDGSFLSMPAKGKSKVTDQQRAAIAARRLIGNTAREIAQEMDVSVRTVERQATDPRATIFIQRQRQRSERALERAWRLGLASILVHLRSGVPELVIQARRDMLRFATAGDPPLLRIAPADNSGGDFTLEQLLTSYRKATVQ